MAAPLTLTTNTTMESQILELLSTAVSMENELAEDVNQDYFSSSLDTETGTITFTATLPIEIAVTSNSTNISAKTYL